MPAIVETSDFISQEAPRVVLISERREVVEACAEQLVSAGFQVATVGHRDSALQVLREDKPPLTIVDLTMPDTAGLEVLEIVRREELETSVIAVSQDGSLKRAVEALKLGAFDYLPEPFDNERLIASMHNALGLKAPAEPVPANREDAIDELHGYINLPPAIRGLYDTIVRAGADNDSVFLTGESGASVQVCAHAVHASSPRRYAPFVPVSCSGTPQDLFESELFGHVQGAFSGAVNDRAGLVTAAHGGTLFFDDICKLDYEIQEKLLRLVQFGTYQRVGKSKLEQVDLRIICASERDPVQEVAEGRFRQDLLDILNPTLIQLPPLRRHGNDLMLLARQFSFAMPVEIGQQPSHATAPGMEIRFAPDRPGSVRALQNVLKDAMGGTADPAASLPQTDQPQPEQQSEELAPAAGEQAYPTIKPLWQVERDAITEALAICGHDVVKAAARLQIDVPTLYRKKAELEARKQSKSG